MNKSILIGRLTKDIDLRYTASNVAVANFTLAVNRAFSNQDGEKETDFINCVCFKKQAENLKKYISKGGLIAVEGRIQTRNYDDKDGKKVYVTEVVADNVQFLETKKELKEDTKETITSREVDKTFEDFGNVVELNDDDIAF